MAHFYVGVFIRKDDPLDITRDDVMELMAPHSVHFDPGRGGEWDFYEVRAAFAPSVSDTQYPPFPCYAVVTPDGRWCERPHEELLQEYRDASFVVLNCHV